MRSFDEIRRDFLATPRDDGRWIVPSSLVTNRATFRSSGVPRQVPIFDRRDDDAIPEADRRWYSIVRPSNANPTDGDEESQGDDATTVYIYDEIGYWGVTAGAFIDELNSISGPITLHVSSPGGEVYDGVAIYNAILNHPSSIDGVVDSLAASAASFIVQACDTVAMEPTAEMMIHDAIGICWDNAAGMRELADRLDAVSDTIAGIYATRAGGRRDSWRNVMRVEQWYSADEAVAAGLADKVLPKAGKRKDGSGYAEDRFALAARWDASTFRHRDRAHAPAPAHDRGVRGPVAVPVDLDAPITVETVETELIISDEQFASLDFDFSAAVRAGLGAAPAANLSAAVFGAALQIGLDEAPQLDQPSALSRVVDREPAPLDFSALLREGMS